MKIQATLVYTNEMAKSLEQSIYQHNNNKTE